MRLGFGIETVKGVRLFAGIEFQQEFSESPGAGERCA